MTDWTSSETGGITPFEATLDRAPHSPSHDQPLETLAFPLGD